MKAYSAPLDHFIAEREGGWQWKYGITGKRVEEGRERCESGKGCMPYLTQQSGCATAVLWQFINMHTIAAKFNVFRKSGMEPATLGGGISVRAKCKSGETAAYVLHIS